MNDIKGEPHRTGEPCKANGTACITTFSWQERSHLAVADMKLYPSPAAALADVMFDGMTLMSGGFGLSGNPESLICEVSRRGTRNLTVISNNAGADGFGLWLLLQRRQIRKMIASYIGENKLFEELCISGELDLELNPQGTLAERIRAGGAGIPAFYTATGVGTVAAEGKPVEVFAGARYIRETWLRADLALIKAWKADPFGNLIGADDNSADGRNALLTAKAPTSGDYRIHVSGAGSGEYVLNLTRFWSLPGTNGYDNV